jgi:2,4-dienoyl-CoA reductase-like NADH-dependent reductase (Old Yellow Enzyme family)
MAVLETTLRRQRKACAMDTYHNAALFQPLELSCGGVLKNRVAKSALIRLMAALKSRSIGAW